MKNSKKFLISFCLIGALGFFVMLGLHFQQDQKGEADHLNPSPVAENAPAPGESPDAAVNDQVPGLADAAGEPSLAAKQKLDHSLQNADPYKPSAQIPESKERTLPDRTMGPLPREIIANHEPQVSEDPEAPLRRFEKAANKAAPLNGEAADDTSLPKSDFVRDTEARVFAYLNSTDQSAMKVDLFFERSPEAVSGFVRAILKCTRTHAAANCRTRTIGLDADTDAEIRATSKADPSRGIASVLSMAGYRGFICAYLPENGGSAEYTIALNVKDDVPENCHIIGGIADPGNLEHRIQTELSTHVKYRYADTTFSSEPHDGSKEAMTRYQKVISLLGKEIKN